jgi:chemotaxis protein methyltransferase CheR
MFDEQNIPLPDDVFRLLRDFIHGYCGIFFDDASKFLLERRLSRRLEQHHLKSFEEYYHFLRYDRKREEELTILVDNLTTNETYFFRESPSSAFPEESSRTARGPPTGRSSASGAGRSTERSPIYRHAAVRIRDGGATGRWRSSAATSISGFCTRHARVCIRRARTA